MKLFDIADDTFAVLAADWDVETSLSFLQGLQVSHIIVERPAAQASDTESRYLFTLAEALTALSAVTPQERRRSVFDVLDLDKIDPTPAWDGGLAADGVPDQTIVLREGGLTGFFDAATPPVIMRGTRGFRFALTDEPTRSADFESASTDIFEAYPSLSAPPQVATNESFEVVVSFRDTIDDGLTQLGSIHVENPGSGDTCLILLLVDGVAVEQNHAPLQFTFDSEARFHCVAGAVRRAATVHAQFFYKNQLIAKASRDITIKAPDDTAVADPPPPSAGHTPTRMNMAVGPSPVDLTITITKSRDQTLLQWTLSATNPWIIPTPIQSDLTGAKQFASSLVAELRTVNFTGPSAMELLVNKGQLIADVMPKEVFAAIEKVHEAVGRTPSVLLVTDELYVPWELAVLPKPLDPTAQPFLSTQTLIGRWVQDVNVMLPPAVTLDVRRFTAVAAGYGGTTGLSVLREAVAERDDLCKRWGALPLRAVLPDLNTVTVGQRIPGHLIHLAVHGLSEPTLNSHAILLEDRKQLVASALAGGYRPGDVPRFSFMFLNACQVGTPGEDLGQAGGFPGKLIRGGTVGFIAPLWEVHDTDARRFAEGFYSTTLDADGESVGTAVQKLRQAYQPAGSTTPLAYIYYGHPLLRLVYQRA